MSYPPTPTNKSCNCSDPCISTDDVYYAGPNLPHSGINTNNILTLVIEKLDAVYAIPTLQKVTEANNYTTLPIIADSFVKNGGTGTNLLLDNGTTIALSSIGGEQDLQSVTDLGAVTTNPITANSFIKSGGDGNNLLLDNGNVLPIGDLPVGVTKTSELTNDGQDGIHPFITAQNIPAFNPSDYDLDEFTNVNVNPFTRLSDLPPPLTYTPVNKAGDTMLGDLILNANPSGNLGAATKQYVDTQVASVNPVPNIAINSQFPINTETLGTFNGNSYSQNGRNVMINNGAITITITATLAPNSFIASYTKVGTSNITFSFTGGTATVYSPNGLVLSGGPGSTALLTKNSTGTAVYLLINNI